MKISAFLGALSRRLLLAGAALIIVYAVVIVLGRQFLPLLDRYETEINGFLSERLGIDVEIHGLGGYWLQLTPVLKLEDLIVHAEDRQRRGIAVEGLTAELDLLNSLASLNPVWKNLRAGEVSIVASEDARGRWRIAGLRVAGAGGDTLEYLLDVLYYSRFLRIDRVNLELHFFSGATARVYGRDIQVENSGDFHRATARFALEDEKGDAARLVLEGRGNPADVGDFAGKGYLKLERINFTGAIRAIANRWFPRQVEKIGAIETDLDAEIWFDWVDSGIENGRGTLRAAEVPLNWVQGEAPPLKALSAEITGWYRPGEDWGFRLQDLSARWRGQAIEPLDLRFVQRVGRRWRELSLAVNHLDLQLLNQMALDTGLPGETLDQVLNQLAPRGTLRNLFLDLDFSGDNPAFRVRANLDDVAVESWRNVPAARGVNGYLEADARHGFVELDSPEGLAMLYPKVYENYMEYGAIRGRVDWFRQPGTEEVAVVGGPIRIDGPEGRGTAYLDLRLPLRRELGAPEMILMVGMTNSRARFADRYIPETLNPALRGWLDDAIGPGDVPRAGFIWRGSLAREERQRRTVQLFVDVTDGRLDYRDGWPPLESLDGRVVVDDGTMTAAVDGARVNDLAVPRVTGVIRRQPRDEGLLLDIRGRVLGDAGEALAVLRQSPLGDRVRALDNWTIAGPSEIGLELTIPLGGDNAGQRYDVTSQLQGVGLALPGTGFQVSDIRGRLGFSLAEGLHGRGIEGRYLGSPVTASVATRDGVTTVDMDGRLTAAALEPYLGRLGGYLDGDARIRGQLVLPGAEAASSPRLTLTSDLQGLSVALPPPFAKPAGEAWPSTGTVFFSGEDIHITGTLDDWLSSRWLVSNGGFRRGEVRFNGGPARVPGGPGLHIAGSLPAWDWEQWRPVLLGGEAGGNRQLLKAADPHLDLTLANLIVSGVELGQTRLSGGLTEKTDWQLRVDSERAVGDVYLPTGTGGLLRLRLDLLRLTDVEVGSVTDGQSWLSRLQPADIPEVDFLARRIELDGDHLGNLAFISRQVPGGVHIDSLRGNLRGIQVGGPAGAIDSNTDGGAPEQGEGEGADTLADLRWYLEDGRHRTEFSGTLTTGDIGDVLQSFGLPRVLDSEHAGFYADLGWSGEPWSPTPAAVRGYLGIDMEEGHFYKASGGATNAFLKLVGLFNFDTWLRRLRFDFSDLFSEGVSFDRLRGGIAFDQGMMTFDDPIVASMPSGKVRLLGRANIATEQLDARLVATIPVGTNLPWVVGLVGGLPAALGVYLTSLIFDEQVDQLSSISYRVTGPWSDPKLEVDRIFSDKANME